MLEIWRQWTTPHDMQEMVALPNVKVLRAVLWLGLIMSLLTSLVAVFSDNAWIERSAGFTTVAVEGAGLLMLPRYPRAVAWGTVLFLWGLVIFLMLFSGGLMSSAVVLLPLVLLVASLSIGWRGHALITALSVFAITVLFSITQRAPHLLPSELIDTGLRDWMTPVAAVVGTGFLLNVMGERLYEVFNRLREREAALQQALDSLRDTSVSKAYFDSILQSMTNMVFVLDEVMTVVTANEAVRETLGYTHEELVGMSLMAILDGDNHERRSVMTGIRGLLATDGGKFHNIARYRTRTGEPIFVDFSASRLRSRDGNRRVVCVANNITEQLAEAEQRNLKQQQLRTVIDNMDAIIFMVDASGRITFSDGKGLAGLSRQPGESVGQNIFELYRDIPEWLADLGRGMAGERLMSVREVRGLTFETHFSPIHDDRGYQTGTLGFAINITERVQAQQALAKERTLLRTLVDSLPDYVYVKDLDGRYLLSNAAHTRYSGAQSEAELLGKMNVEVLSPTHCHRQTLSEGDLEVIESRQPYHRVVECTPPDTGETLWMQITKVPLLMGDDITGIISLSSDITPRKRDEIKIRRNEERLAALINNAPVYLFSIDRDYNLAELDWQWVGADENKVMEQLGIALGRDAFVPETNGEDMHIAAHVARAFTGETVKSTMRVDDLTFDIRYSPMTDENNVITGVIGVATDITERVQVEERNRALLAALPDMIFTVNRAGEFTDFSLSDNRQLLMPREQIVGSTIYDLERDPETKQRVSVAIAACLDTGTLQTVEYEIKEMSEFFESRYAKLNEDEVLAVVRDITEARQAQEEVRRREKMYRTLARNLPCTTVMLVDKDLRCLLAEGPALVERGYDLEAIEGQRLDRVFPREQVNMLMPLFPEVMAGHTRTFEFETNDHAHLYSGTALPLANEQGDIYAGMIVLRDVTDNRRRTQELEQFTEELARSNRALQEFAYVASHDLKEPLRKIQAFGSRLQKHMGDDLDAQTADYLARMIRASDRMKQLIDDLLMYSRLSTRVQPFQPTDLNAVVQQVLDDLEVQVEAVGAQVNVAKLPVILAESYQMHQLFQNLIGNALKYTRQGVIPLINVEAETFTEVGGWYVRVRVSDNGIGFDIRHAETVFGLFNRLHGHNAYDGTGVGLAICRKIAETHGGAITADSTPGVGTTFTVILPVTQ